MVDSEYSLMVTPSSMEKEKLRVFCIMVCSMEGGYTTSQLVTGAIAGNASCCSSCLVGEGDNDDSARPNDLRDGDG